MQKGEKTADSMYETSTGRRKKQKESASKMGRGGGGGMGSTFTIKMFDSVSFGILAY